MGINIDNTIYDIWLSNIPGLGIISQLRLLEIFKTSKKVFEIIYDMNFEDCGKELVMNKKSFEIAKDQNMEIAQNIMKEMKSHSIRAISYSSEEYPKSLLSIYDYPIVLYVMGNIYKEECISIVGARKASNYGKWAAKSIAMKLVEYNFQIVSGLALGIDAAAHIGAIEANGKTIAVLGCGPDICYPQTNRKLYEEISKKGTIISEFAPGAVPFPNNFPRRNRIISGLSKAVIVAEAGLNSGSLITVDFAHEQGREVYAVPGNINNIYSLGNNKLIKEGATPLIKIDDIIYELGLEKHEADAKINMSLGKDEKIIYGLVFKSGEISIDAIAKKTNKSISEVKAIVSILEIKGILESSLGKIFIA